MHYAPRRQPENEQLQAWVIELASERRRFGYRRLHALVWREGVRANHKCVYRPYEDAGLAVKRRRKRVGVAVEREPLELPSAPNQVWSMDFVSDALGSDRHIKILTIVDDCTKEAVRLVTDFGISGLYVSNVLDQAARFRGKSIGIRTDQWPEFTGKVLYQWAYRNGVQLKLI